MHTYRVMVRDRRYVAYVVEAKSADDAREMVEASEDADAEFGGTTKDGEWSVEDVQRCDNIPSP